VKHAEHHQTIAVEAVLEHILRMQHLQHDLAIFLVTRQRSAKPWVIDQELRSGDDRLRDAIGEMWMGAAKELSDAIKVSQGVG
jgi:hypothetical protein